MKTFLPCLILLIAGFSSCKKNTESPTASFTFRGMAADTYKMGTGDTITLISRTNAKGTVNWDLGDGTSSAQRNVLASFAKAGTYNVKLTVTDDNGQQNTVSKTITVMDRVLKSIVVNSVYWDPSAKTNNEWPQSATASIFVQFQQYRAGDPITPYTGMLPNSPILFTSQVVPGIGYKTNTSFELPVSGRFVIDKRMLENRSLVMFLMAKDANGKLYNIVSNRDSGSSWTVNDDIKNNRLTINCNLMSSINLNVVYE